MVDEAAGEAGVHTVTLYRWIQRFESTGKVSALVRVPRSGGRGRSRLSPDVETVLVATIEEDYLRAEKPNIEHTAEEVERRCRNAGLKAPHPNTVRNRIKLISEKEKVKRRKGPKAARIFEPLKGRYPDAHWPLSVIQIDHTKLDVILVDDIHRLPIGRPWITIAIDVFSRMVTGFYIAFEPPSAMSVGLCLAHSILPKDEWLSDHDINTPWPIWGLMRKVHADNAREFRGTMLSKACSEYGIDLEWRPVKKPQYGAHIERLLGTLNNRIHGLPGTTSSNTKSRGDYPAEQKAVFTLNEFEAWLGILIVEAYHQREHSQLLTSPVGKFEQGIFGTGDTPGCGLPDRIIDEDRLRIDLMPYEIRTVQPYGLLIDDIHYFSDVLRPWVHATDPENDNQKRKFVIRRDPRDISQVYFYDPELNQHFLIPYRDNSRPAITLWELREVRRRLKEEGRKHIDENAIFEAYNRMKEIEQNATRETKKVRRANQRQRSAKRQPKPKAPVSRFEVPSAKILETPATEEPDILDDADIEPFEVDGFDYD
ncbi:Mu transposase C-terminal domain-containing protein [Thiohalomonas denitrificans]|nr:Mu transposase C-terminal domain-containing protein [Thiohalomonas denitrificans]